MKNLNKNKINLTVSLIASIMIPLLTLFRTTAFLNEYGKSINGFTVFFNSIIGYVLLSDFGVAGIIIPRYYQSLVKNDKLAINENYNAHKRFQKITGFYITIALIFAAIFSSFRPNGMPQLHTILIALSMALNVILTNNFLNHNNSLLTVKQYGFITNGINYGVICLTLILDMVLISFHVHYLVVLLLSNMLIASATLIRTFVSKKMIKEYIYLSKKRSILSIESVKYMFLQQVSSVINLQTDVILIYLFISNTAISTYGTYMLLSDGIANLFITSIFSIAPNFALELNKNLKNGINYFKKIVIVLSCCAIVFSICFYFGAIPFWNILIIKNVGFTQFQISLITIILIWKIMRLPYTIIINVRGLYKEVAPNTVFEMIGNIVLSCIFGYYFGISGILIGTIISTCIIEILFKARKVLILTDILFLKIYYKALKEVIILSIIIIILTKFLFGFQDGFNFTIFDWIIYMSKIGLLTSAITAIYFGITYYIKKENKL